MKQESGCEYCANYTYEEEYGCYVCDADLDEDEMERFLRSDFVGCPYFQTNDEYKIVRKQI
ncbi:DUF6472 family protein [Lacrimispora sp. NSJ-141]|uniref:DUF6472 family protein n=1 Tax=Lientehia hominis TaxID=2897778 RepID=A0AAP2RK41_9FIRM|nr:DUF6472 family protein [Lientehia hominis]